MRERRLGQDGHEIAFEAFGVRVLVSGSPPEVLNLVRDLLPPGWRPCRPASIGRRFGIMADSAGAYEVTKDGTALTKGQDLDLALGLLDAQFRIYVAQESPHMIFVHAGVVAHRGRTMVLPGMSFAGKTTLVAALVRLGAIYYSDEFAVLDDCGQVHPYAKPLSLRGDSRKQTDHRVESLGGIAGKEPLPVGVIVVTSYRPGACWKPRVWSAGEGVLALLGNAVPVQERPAQTLRAITRAADCAVVIASDRAEADDVAPLLIAELER